MDIQSINAFLDPVVRLFGNQPWIRAIVVFLLFLITAQLIANVLVKVIAHYLHKTRTRIDDAIISMLRRPLFWTLVMIGVMASIASLKPPTGVMSATRGIILTTLIFTWSVFAAQIIRLILKAMSLRATSTASVRPQTLPLFNNLTSVLVVILSIYFVFQAWNIDMTAWLASAGIVGIAVGFAAKDTLANLFSGVFILADAPYKIGDYVILESGERGKVTEIGIRSTRILTRDDVEVTVPNSIMGNTRIVNESGGPYEKFRIRVQVSVSYTCDIDQVRSVLMKIAADEPEVCDDPEPRVRFRAFGASGLDIELLAWVENPELRGRVLDALNTTVYKRFAETGIEIPYSKQDVYIKDWPKRDQT
ncbi:MAG: mechanosensitive ion channel family protein [Acidiferrobacterales bacterium]|nr:mechanosensitive ion channel family protein [Acidiferrobacterales bacterium]